MIPAYIGPCAFGIKMGVITPGCDLPAMILDVVEQCDKDRLLDDGDVVCITESIVARAQDNFITTADIAQELREKHAVKPDDTIGVLFPITSRNRFALILKGFARAVPRGEVVVQFSYPCDEVGNEIISEIYIEELEDKDLVPLEKVNHLCCHPITKLNYPLYYKEMIEKQGARANIYFSNDPEMIIKYNPSTVIVSSIHSRAKISNILKKKGQKCITLQDIFNDPSNLSWSEWGLLGSNMSSEEMLNLAPKEGDRFAGEVQEMILRHLGKKVEVLIYGDGAYKDPTSGIYELADPQPSFGNTDGFKNCMREGVKYKYLADTACAEGKSVQEIEEMLCGLKKKKFKQDEMVTEGTTPRQMEDVIASLADLVSGSADAGTPVILVKGFFNER